MATTKAAQAATKKYKKKHDNCMVYFPLGTADAVRDQGASVSGLCKKLVAAWLAERGVVLDQEPRKDQPEKISGKNPREPEPVIITPGAPELDIKPGKDQHTTPAGGQISPDTPQNGIIDIDTFL